MERLMLSAEALEQLTATTLADYEASAQGFWTGTKDHDVTQNYDALLSAIEGAPPFSILDFGCGPGRDLMHFRALGHDAVGLDGCEAFVQMARANSGCEVWQQNFLKLDLPEARFDGIFANASLFHVPQQELPRVLCELAGALKPGGVLFSSNPRGNNQEGWNGGRYGAFIDHVTWKRTVEAANFTELDHYYRPQGLPRAQQPWLASVFRKQVSQVTGM